jgi:hypothetical protein
VFVGLSSLLYVIRRIIWLLEEKDEELRVRSIRSDPSQVQRLQRESSSAGDLDGGGLAMTSGFERYKQPSYLMSRITEVQSSINN